VDWEFGKKVSEQNFSTYDGFRGTIGFSGNQSNIDPQAADWKAFEACMKFLEIEPNDSFNDLKAKSKRFCKWLKKI
jgi:hypothetical protein